MSYTIIHDDIVDLKIDADAVVIPVGPEPGLEKGKTAELYRRAGALLSKARRDIGMMEVGQAAITMAYDLDVIYVIHTVCPIWEEGQSREDLLLTCYRNSLELARTHDCRSVVFPVLAVEEGGFPEEVSRRIAHQAFDEFSAKYDLQIYLAEG